MDATTHSHAIFEVSAYLRKYDAAVSSYRFEVMKTHSYLPCEELQMDSRSFLQPTIFTPWNLIHE